MSEVAGARHAVCGWKAEGESDSMALKNFELLQRALTTSTIQKPPKNGGNLSVDGEEVRMGSREVKGKLLIDYYFLVIHLIIYFYFNNPFKFNP